MKVQFLGHLIETDYIYEITPIYKAIKKTVTDKFIPVAARNSVIWFEIKFLNEKEPLRILKYVSSHPKIDLTTQEHGYFTIDENIFDEAVEEIYTKLEKSIKELISYTGQSIIPKIEW